MFYIIRSDGSTEVLLKEDVKKLYLSKDIDENNIEIILKEDIEKLYLSEGFSGLIFKNKYLSLEEMVQILLNYLADELYIPIVDEEGNRILTSTRVFQE